MKGEYAVSGKCCVYLDDSVDIVLRIRLEMKNGANSTDYAELLIIRR